MRLAVYCTGLFVGSVAILGACDLAWLGGAEEDLRNSVFDSEPNQHCELRHLNGDLLSAAGCASLTSLVDPTSEACRQTGPLLGYFPGRELPMQLCRQDNVQQRQEQQQIRFISFADAGRGENPAKGYLQQTVATMMHRVCPPRSVNATDGCDFAVVAGDLIYPSGVTSVWDSRLQVFFENIYAAQSPMPFYLVPGNHDYHGNVQALIEYSLFSKMWRMPARNYALPDLPPWVRIVGIDTQTLAGEYGSEDERAQIKQLMRDQLCGYDGWRILLGHYPVASQGDHGSHLGTAAIVKETLAECPYHLYIGGHDHHQELTRVENRIAIVQGGGGANTRDVRRIEGQQSGDGRYGMSVWQQEYAAARHGFAVIELDAQMITLEFYDANAWLADGTKLDPAFVYRAHKSDLL